MGTVGVLLASAAAVVATPSVASATSAGTVSYEADCTISLEAGQVVPFKTTLEGDTSVDTAAPTGATFGFSGTATTTVVGAIIANLYALGVGVNPLESSWKDTIGPTDANSTGSYSYSSPTLSESDGGGETTASAISWDADSTTLTAKKSTDWGSLAVGDAVASSTAGIPNTATVTALSGTTATISVATTAAGSKATLGFGADTVFTDSSVNTGDVFTTDGASGDTAGIGVASVTQVELNNVLGTGITFGGAPGDGKSNCLETGYTAGGVAGPAQTCGDTPPCATSPGFPAGTTTPLPSVSPLEFPPAATVALQAAETVPGAPTIGTAEAGNASATVNWTAPSSDGGSPITGYVITPYISGTAQTPIDVGNVTTFDVTGLTNGTTYTFTVAATNAIGTGDASAQSNAVTPESTITVPGAPTIGTAEAGNASATVNWTAPSSDGGSPITGYVITPYISGTAQTPIDVGNVTTFDVTGLTNGTTYTFTVAATNAVGTGDASAQSNAVTPSAVAPGAPTIGTATAGNASATVNWTAPSSDGGSPITGYVITPYIGGTAQTPIDVGKVTSDDVTGLTNGTTYTFTVAATNAVGTGPASAHSNAVTPSAPPPPPPVPSSGYWLITSTGQVNPHGSAQSYGSPTSLNAAIVGAAATPDGKGYWLAGADGGVFAYGDAHFYGSMGGKPLNAPVVGMASTPDGKGYWLVAADGGIFSFGDAHFYGSMGGKPLNAPVVGIAATADGKGYWMVAADGGIFSFGDAHFSGSMGGKQLNAPVVGMASSGTTGGYWLVGSDGGVFTFGSAHFNGSAVGQTSGYAVTGMAALGSGYVLSSSNGGVFAYDAPFYGSNVNTTLAGGVVAIVS